MKEPSISDSQLKMGILDHDLSPQGLLTLPKFWEKFKELVLPKVTEIKHN